MEVFRGGIALPAETKFKGGDCRRVFLYRRVGRSKSVLTKERKN